MNNSQAADLDYNLPATSTIEPVEIITKVQMCY